MELLCPELMLSIMAKAENIVLNCVISRIHRLENSVVRIKRQLPQHENQIDLIAGALADLHVKVDGLDKKIDQKADSLEQKLAQKPNRAYFEARMGRVEEKLDLVLDALAMKK